MTTVDLRAYGAEIDLVRETLGCFLKDETDLRAVGEQIDSGHLAAMASPAA